MREDALSELAIMKVLQSIIAETTTQSKGLEHTLQQQNLTKLAGTIKRKVNSKTPRQPVARKEIDLSDLKNDTIPVR